MNESAVATTDEIWVLTDGRAGHISQTLGLAEALTPVPVVKQIGLKSPYRQLSPFLGWGDGRSLTPDSASILAPWPRLVITSGRSAIPIALAIKRKTGGRTPVVNVQDPGWLRGRFDLIIVPEHDELTGPNVMTTAGALSRITPARLAVAAAEFGPQLDHLPRPRVAVLIGGANAVFQAPRAVAERIAGQLAGIAAKGVGLMVTFSRRTGPEMQSIVRAALAGSAADIWSGDGPNPYFAYLALADVILATEDSASMVSEAATTGKPIHILPLEGGSPKFTRFHDSMRTRGITRPFAGGIENWTYPPFDETARAADAVRRLAGLNSGTL
ncbi:MAG TPA: mitochondrial fission ELM1 family protein [Alphaproteobacteria bacterium]|nr:mitochondrial fission ELM1 family protein [Alphaproteobacteria bacterium]